MSKCPGTVQAGALQNGGWPPSPAFPPHPGQHRHSQHTLVTGRSEGGGKHKHQQILSSGLGHKPRLESCLLLPGAHFSSFKDFLLRIAISGAKPDFRPWEQISEVPGDLHDVPRVFPEVGERDLDWFRRARGFLFQYLLL